MITSNDTFLNLRKIIESMCVKDNPNHKLALERLFLSYQYPGLENRAIKDLILVLWKMDTLGDSSTWSLFHVDEMYFLRRIKLKNKNPYHLLTPDSFGSESSLSNESALKLINSLPKPLPRLNTSDDIVIDGIKCGIISNDINVEWYYKLSQSVKLLESWFKKSVFKFDSLFASPEHKKTSFHYTQPPLAE